MFSIIATSLNTVSPKNSQQKYLLLSCLALYFSLVDNREMLQFLDHDYLQLASQQDGDESCWDDWEQQPNYVTFSQFVEYINFIKQTETDPNKQNQLILDYFKQNIVQEINQSF